MGKQISRTTSYSTVRRSRRVEIVVIAFVIVCIIAGTFTTVILKRISRLYETCNSDSHEFSVNITDAEGDDDTGYKSDDGMLYPPGAFWKSNGSVFGCPCLIKPCVRKCCPANKMYHPEFRNCTVDYAKYFKSFVSEVFSNLYFLQNVKDLKQKTVSSDHFFVLHGNVCPPGYSARLDPESEPSYLMEDGRVLTVDRYLDQSNYCLESIVGNNSVVYTFECIEDVQESSERADWMFNFLAFGMLSSVPFLIATLLIYAILDPLRNLHGKALICHVACITTAFIALPTTQIGRGSVPENLCIILAYIIQLSFLASFFWLNVMCFDMWWVFSGLKPLRGSIKEAEHWKFLVYSCYAWGGSLLISATSLFMDFAPWVPKTFIRPEFGVASCWFKERDATTLYFYLPVGSLICLNLLMFATTASRLRSYTNDANFKGESRRHNQCDRQRFNLYLKLLVIMGIPWAMEIISFMSGGEQFIWIFTDLLNTLQGPLIFFIFVCRRRIFRLLKQKFLKTDPFQPRTSTSRFSRTSSNPNFNHVVYKSPDIVLSSTSDKD